MGNSKILVNNKGVSPVIGVILMIAITVIFAYGLAVLVFGTSSSVSITDHPAYSVGYNDYPNETLYNECLPYSVFSFSSERYNETCEAYCTGWKSAKSDSKTDDLDLLVSKINNRTEVQ